MNSDPRKRGNDPGGIVRDNVFHRRVSQVRNQNLTYDEMMLLELLNGPGPKQQQQQQQQPDREPGIFENNEEERVVYTQDDIDRIAFFDDTRPVYNYRYLLRKFRREMSRSRRYNRPVSVVVVALDGLRNIAREYGYLSAESAVLTAAETINSCIRSDVDLAGRYGDDKFILVLPETPGNGAGVLCERIRKKFESIQIKHQWYVIPVTASLGISHFPGHGTECAELIARADIASEKVQGRGGNGVGFAPEPGKEE